MRARRLFNLVGLTVAAAAVLTACGSKTTKAITIVYTNDVHSYIANTTRKNASGDTITALRLSNVKGEVDSLKADGKNVLLVDAGDEIQGNVYGGYDKGSNMIDIMNECEYDLATPGNHDFDFGVDRLMELTNQANYPYISCNFETTADNQNVFDSYKIFKFGSTKVAFVGISTPETITSSTPTFFMNDDGTFKYEFVGEKDASELYERVQKTVNKVQKKADYVIALGHLGIGADAEKAGYRSVDIINNTSGIDAFIDGHSHTEIEGEIIKNKNGKDVVLTQTGAYLDNFGEMEISTEGKISTKLISTTDKTDSSVANKENKYISEIAEILGKKIAVLDNTMYVNDYVNTSARIIRAQETNLGDLASDAIYWYFNDNLDLNCDLAIVNGGGIRAQVEPGDLSYLSLKTVHPFGNVLCLVKVRGQVIKDCLEMGVRNVGQWDSQWNAPLETGEFMHVAGMKFSVDASITSGVQLDEVGMFTKVTGDYRVKDIQIYNKITHEYEDLDVDKEYTVGGQNYILKNCGGGASMFKGSETVIDFSQQDYLALAAYVQAFAKGDDNYSHINTVSCPLAKYTNYLLNYENPYGSGRINILNLNYNK